MMLASLSGAAAFTFYTLSGTFLPGYYIGAVFGGFTYSLGMMMPTSIIIRRWFNKDRGLALGLASAGTGLSTMLCSPLLQYIIDTYGVSGSFLFEVGYMIVCAVCLLIVIREFPEDRGTEPVGGKKWKNTGVKGKDRRYTPLSAGWLLLLTAMALIAGLGGTPSTSNFVLNFTTSGLDSMTVSFGMTVYGFLLICSKLLFGRVVDKKGSCFATALFGTLVTIGLLGCFAVAWFPTDAFMFTCFIFLGFGYGVVTLGYPNWAADFTASENYPHIMKRFMIGFQLGALLGSPLPGIIADLTGGYSLAYLMFASAFAIMSACVIATYRRHRFDASST